LTIVAEWRYGQPEVERKLGAFRDRTDQHHHKRPRKERMILQRATLREQRADLVGAADFA